MANSANGGGQGAPENDGHEPGGKTGTSSGGEDEASTENEGEDSHLHENQKSRTLKT